MFCYETSVILNPFLKIVNATIENFTVKIGGKSSLLKSDEFVVPLHIDFETSATLSVGSDEKVMHTINPFKNKKRDLL